MITLSRGARRDAANQQTPAWLRLIWLAKNREDAQGIARFRRGEIARLMDQGDVKQAIERAQRLGYIGRDSTPKKILLGPDSLRDIEARIGRMQREIDQLVQTSGKMSHHTSRRVE